MNLDDRRGARRGPDPRWPATVVLGYSEIAIKRKNRLFFTQVLKRNLARSLGELGLGPVRTVAGRLLLSFDRPLERDLRARVASRLDDTLGVAYYAFVDRELPRDLDQLDEAVIAVVRSRVVDGGEGANSSAGWGGERERGRPGPTTFRIDATRGDKTYPLTSPELNSRLGAAVRREIPLEVSLDDAELSVHVVVLQDRFLVYTERNEGERGLPVGSSGRVVCLLSSGIDSPVAAYRLMRRGCRVYFVHFHSVPYTERASIELAGDLVEQLSRYQHSSYLFLVPLAEIQQRIVTSAPEPLRLLLYRRFMTRLAERIARRVRGKALVTGESVAQVASQTLENIAAIDDAATIPLLRPLIGMDKEEIMAEARRLGTYEISTQPYEDCCAFLMPQRPETHARLSEVQRADEALGDMSECVRRALRGTEVRRVRGGVVSVVRPGQRA